MTPSAPPARADFSLHGDLSAEASNVLGTVLYGAVESDGRKRTKANPGKKLQKRCFNNCKIGSPTENHCRRRRKNCKFLLFACCFLTCLSGCPNLYILPSHVSPSQVFLYAHVSYDPFSVPLKGRRHWRPTV